MVLAHQKQAVQTVLELILRTHPSLLLATVQAQKLHPVQVAELAQAQALAQAQELVPAEEQALVVATLEEAEDALV